MSEDHILVEPRRYPRVFLGMQVAVRLPGEPDAQAVEIINASMGGCYFRAPGSRPRRGHLVAFGFVTAEHTVCAARGRVVRVDDVGFALQLEGTNSAFQRVVEDAFAKAIHSS